jgi:putative hydrolase of the HAD superfamily
MNTRAVVRALILDFGEVLVRPQSAQAVENMARLARLGIEEFTQRYWRHRPAYDRGELSGTGYWRQVLSDQIDLESDDPRIEALKRSDSLSWVDYREDMWELAMRFRETHGRTALLSNGVPEVMGRVRTDRPLSEYFDAVIISCEVGCAKPDPRIYQLCLTALGVSARSALFVDDRRENIDAAAHLGLQVFQFKGDESTADLRSLVVAS